jgi:hypothetical protein
MGHAVTGRADVQFMPQNLKIESVTGWNLWGEGKKWGRQTLRKMQAKFGAFISTFIQNLTFITKYFNRMVSSGLLRRAALVRTDVSEEPGASFIRVTKIGELGTITATSNRRTLRRNTWYLFLVHRFLSP